MNKVKGSPAIILALASVLAYQAERIAASDVTPTGTNRWFAERYNVNNAWIFNGNNGNLNNNNVNNANRVQAVAILPIFKVLRFYHDRDFVLCFVAQRDAFYQKE